MQYVNLLKQEVHLRDWNAWVYTCKLLLAIQYSFRLQSCYVAGGPTSILRIFYFTHYASRSYNVNDSLVSVEHFQSICSDWSIVNSHRNVIISRCKQSNHWLHLFGLLIKIMVLPMVKLNTFLISLIASFLYEDRLPGSRFSLQIFSHVTTLV